MNEETRIHNILAEWSAYMGELVALSSTHPDVRKRIEAQIKEIKEKHQQRPEEDVYSVWKRIAERMKAGHTLDMADVIRVNNHMTEAQRLLDDSYKETKRGPEETDTVPAVPRRTLSDYTRDREG